MRWPIFSHYVSAMLAVFKKDYERLANEADKALALNRIDII